MKLNTAVIGAGNMGKNHARVYSEVSRLTAISDVVEDVGHSLANKYGVNYYKDYKKMLDVEKPDAVSVVVPIPFHKDITIECLKRGTPTLVEKPIAITSNEGKQMIRESKKNNAFLMVGHIERFNPAIIKLKRYMEMRKFGDIISLLSIRVGINPPKTSRADVALDLAIHDVDVFNYLLDDFPVGQEIIRAKIFEQNISDSSIVLLRYPKTTGVIQTNWVTPIKMRKLYVTGTNKFCEVDYIKQKLIVYDKSKGSDKGGNYSDTLSFSENLKKEEYVSKKEPLKQEIIFFLKNRNNMDYSDSNTSHALRALEILELK